MVRGGARETQHGAMERALGMAKVAWGCREYGRFLGTTRGRYGF